jgi:hypothetical protein
MLFFAAPFAYLSSRRDPSGEAAPVYPAWLLPSLQNTLATLADEALEREVKSERMPASEERSPMADAARQSGPPLVRANVASSAPQVVPARRACTWPVA